jgi:hypothetical protein
LNLITAKLKRVSTQAGLIGMSVRGTKAFLRPTIVTASVAPYFIKAALYHNTHALVPTAASCSLSPGLTPDHLHRNVLANALNIDVGIFCDDILTGAERWLAQVEGTQPYEKNYDRFLTRYPNGLPPYIGGIPVIG